MPTASMLAGAPLFAVLSYVAPLLASPLLDGLPVNSHTPRINSGIGFCIGWFVAGPRDGGGLLKGMSNRLTATVVGLLAVLVMHGTIFALRASWRGRFRDPIDAMVDFVLRSALRIIDPQELVLLGLGGGGIGLLLEFTHARAS